MPALVVPNAVQAVVRGVNLGRPWVNVIGIRFGADGTGGGVFLDQTLASALGSAVRAGYAAQQGSFSTSWTLQEILIFDLQSSIAPSYDAGITTLTGTGTGDSMPSNVAACVTHRTNYRGRSYRGRTYLCGQTESSNSSTGQIPATTRTNLEGIFSTMRTQLATVANVSARQAVISRKLAEAFEVVTSQCDENWDHQDRRKT